MGTSQSKPSAKPGSPLIPSWAEQDPPPPGAPQPQPPQNQEVLEPRRTTGLRRALKDYLKTGDERIGRRALGHYARGSAGGGAAGAARLGRAARIGGQVFGALSGAGRGEAPAPGSFDISTLAGHSVADAIAAIVDAFCPPGILDEDTIRASLAESLAEALTGADQFDPAALDDFTVVVAMRCFVAEMVFAAVAAEQGQAAANIPPAQAVARENDLRDIVRELTDVKATPVLQQAAGPLSQVNIETLVRQIAADVIAEMATW